MEVTDTSKDAEGGNLSGDGSGEETESTLRGQIRRPASSVVSEEEESDEETLGSRTAKRRRQGAGSSAEGAAGPSVTPNLPPEGASTDQTVVPSSPPPQEALIGSTVQPLSSPTASAVVPSPAAALLEKSPPGPASKRSRRRYMFAGAVGRR